MKDTVISNAAESSHSQENFDDSLFANVSSYADFN